MSTPLNPSDDPAGRRPAQDPTAPPVQPYDPPPSTPLPPGAAYPPPPAGAPGGFGPPPGQYGAPSYGQLGAEQYGQYGQPPMGYGPPVLAAPYAEWPLRVGATVVDAACYFGVVVVGAFIAVILSHVANALGTLFLILTYLAAFAFVVWQLVVQGQTGQTIGKRVLNIRLVAETTGQPVGPGLSIGRALLHVADSLPCYLGYLWPLWDVKKQTFADKIVHTVVLRHAG